MTGKPFNPWFHTETPDKPNESLALHIRNNLLRECLPHLIEKEHGTRTCNSLRALISEIEQVTRA